MNRSAKVGDIVVITREDNTCCYGVEGFITKIGETSTGGKRYMVERYCESYGRVIDDISKRNEFILIPTNY